MLWHDHSTMVNREAKRYTIQWQVVLAFPCLCQRLNLAIIMYIHSRLLGTLHRPEKVTKTPPSTYLRRLLMITTPTMHVQLCTKWRNSLEMFHEAITS